MHRYVPLLRWLLVLLTAVALAGWWLTGPFDRPSPPLVIVTPQPIAPTPSAPLDVNMIDEALSYAYEVADPYEKEGFVLHEDYWGGILPVKTSKAIEQQLFKGNEYWFWMGSATPKSRISVHIYDHEGKLAEVESWQKNRKAAARVLPKRTGTYYLVVEIESSPLAGRAYWALAYGFQSKSLPACAGR